MDFNVINSPPHEHHPKPHCDLRCSQVNLVTLLNSNTVMFRVSVSFHHCMRKALKQGYNNQCPDRIVKFFHLVTLSLEDSQLPWWLPTLIILPPLSSCDIKDHFSEHLGEHIRRPARGLHLVPSPALAWKVSGLAWPVSDSLSELMPWVWLENVFIFYYTAYFIVAAIKIVKFCFCFLMAK